MKQRVYLGRRAIDLDLTRPIGEGGEAVILPLGTDQVVKLFRKPDDPLYAGSTPEAVRNREGARRRLEVHQRKLPAFPSILPARVVVPTELARSTPGGNILGYSMPLVPASEPLRQYAQVDWRTRHGVSGNEVVEIFRDLHATVKGVHARGVVIGDFNHLNIMVRGKEAFMIDADSMQWGEFWSETFTPRYVDPLICNPKGDALLMHHHPNSFSDWYAFALMLWESLLFVHPYGGVFRPKNAKKRVTFAARPLKRITVFHPEVMYPTFGIPFASLPDELLEFFEELLLKDKRGEFPEQMLNLRWTKCLTCGAEHGRPTCPHCSTTAIPELKKTIIRSNAASNRVFYTPNGTILEAVIQNGKLNVLYHEDGKFHREDGGSLLEMELNRKMKFRISGAQTVISSDGKSYSFVGSGAGEAAPQRIAAERFRGGYGVFDTNDRHIFWIQGGQLMRSDGRLPKSLGSVMEGQTLLWVGPEFGLTFYRVGNIQRATLFDTTRGGPVTVAIPQLNGEPVFATTHFTENHCWFLVAVNRGGKIVNHAFLIRRDATLVASAECEEGDDSWLGLPLQTGKCGAMLSSGGKSINTLLVATQDGLVGVLAHQGVLTAHLQFQGTQGLVDPSHRLLYHAVNGVYAIGKNEIRVITAKP